jgi:hypothetical protein
MSYVQLPQIDDRKSEKMAVLLTAENMAGLLLVAGPVYLATTGWGFLPRIVALVLAAVVGVTLTLSVGGMPLYARLLWQLRGVIWQHVQGGDIHPEALPGAVQRSERGVVLPVQGVARVVHRVPPQPPQSHVASVARHRTQGKR